MRDDEFFTTTQGSSPIGNDKRAWLRRPVWSDSSRDADFSFSLEPGDLLQSWIIRADGILILCQPHLAVFRSSGFVAAAPLTMRDALILL